MLWSGTRKRTKRSKDVIESDADLLARLKKRDERAFLALYDRYRRPVYRFLMHMTGSFSTAEELTQEVFVAILDAMCVGTVGQFDPGKGSMEGYLMGIARNLAREEHRRVNRLQPLDTVVESPEWDRLMEKFSQPGQDASMLLTTHSELKVLYRAILELPAHYREVVILCSLEEKSYQQAAAVLRCSEGTIASRMNRAKALLAAKLRRLAPDAVNS